MGSVKSIIKLFVFFVLPWPLNGQGQEMPDSLIMELERTYNKERKLEILWKVVRKTYRVSDYDTTMFFAKQQLNLAKILENKKRYADATARIGMLYKFKKKFHNAGAHLFQALHLYEQLGDKDNTAMVLYNIGQVFKKGGEFEKSVLYLQKALDIYKFLDEEQFEAKTHYELARGYLELGNHNKSLFHLNQCLKLNDVSENQGLTSKAHNYLGINYYQLKLYDKAIEEYSRARDYAVGLADYDKKLAIAFNNIGEVYVEKGDYEKARSHYEKALALKREYGDLELLAGTLINLGKLALLENRPSEAIPYLEEIIFILDKDRLSDNLKEASVLLAEAYKSKQDLTSKDLQKIMSLNEQYARHIHDLKQTGFQQSMVLTASKSMLEHETLYLKNKVKKSHNLTLWVIGFSIIIIVGFLLLLYHRERKFKLFIQKMWEDIKDI